MNQQLPKGLRVVSCQAIDADWKIEVTNRLSDPVPTYAVRRFSNCLNKEGEWEYEPMPSSRDDDFLARCRWDNWDQLIVFLRQQNMLPNE